MEQTRKKNDEHRTILRDSKPLANTAAQEVRAEFVDKNVLVTVKDVSPEKRKVVLDMQQAARSAMMKTLSVRAPSQTLQALLRCTSGISQAIYWGHMFRVEKRFKGFASAIVLEGSGIGSAYASVPSSLACGSCGSARSAAPAVLARSTTLESLAFQYR